MNSTDTWIAILREIMEKMPMEQRTTAAAKKLALEVRRLELEKSGKNRYPQVIHM